MLSCEKATKLMVKEAESAKNLSFSKRISWRIHAALCKTCELFNKQNRIIDKLLELQKRHNISSKLSVAKKVQLKNMINEALNRR